MTKEGQQVTVGKWVELFRPVTFDELKNSIKPEFLRRGDLVLISMKHREERMEFSGGSIGAGRFNPELTELVFWPWSLLSTFPFLHNFFKKKLAFILAGEKIITGYLLKPGKVIEHFEADPIMPEMYKKIYRQRGQSQLTAEYF